MDIKVGNLVFSKAGRDKGKIFIVLNTDGNYAYISDGDLRKVEKPKKKKLIHLQGMNYMTDEDIGNITNSKVRNIIAQHKPV